MDFISTILIFAVLAGVGSAMIASNRGESGPTWFFIGLLLGPFGVLWALTTGQRCEHCQSRIHLQATACPKCGNKIEQDFPEVAGDDLPDLSDSQTETTPENFRVFIVGFAIILIGTLTFVFLSK